VEAVKKAKEGEAINMISDDDSVDRFDSVMESSVVQPSKKRTSDSLVHSTVSAVLQPLTKLLKPTVPNSAVVTSTSTNPAKTPSESVSSFILKLSLNNH
jgi:hypothetical protein